MMFQLRYDHFNIIAVIQPQGQEQYTSPAHAVLGIAEGRGGRAERYSVKAKYPYKG